MRLNNLAFSLAEALITIGVISLLTTIAVYSYPTYVAKSQMAAAVNIIDAYKTAIQSYFVENGNMPTTIPANVTNYVGTDNDPISSITYDASGSSPRIIVNFGNKASSLLRNQSITVQISIDNTPVTLSGYTYGATGVFNSTCTTSGIPNNILPSYCQS